MRINTSPLENLKTGKNIFVPLFKNKPLTKEEFFSYTPDWFRKLTPAFEKEFEGEEGEIKTFHSTDAKQTITLFGLGEKDKFNQRKLQTIARRMARHAKNGKIEELSIILRNDFGDTKNTSSLFATNILAANFEFNKYKEKPKNGWPEIKKVLLVVDKKDTAEAKTGLTRGVIIGEETNFCRELANTPGGDITPQKLAEEAKKTAGQNKISIKSFDEKEIQKIGMGGILGVSKGSTEKPRFIILEYLKGPKEQKPLVFVGKGVTFDTGGLSLKPEQYMYEMHMDMSGGAAVIHGMAAIARLNLPINAIGIIPAVENMPSGSSFRPGDILKSLSGKTIEVLNTDAEGRIILADALVYALRYKPGFILDLATLTGAAHVALGNYCSALFTNQPKLQEKLIEIGENSGDYVWPLPLWDEYLNDIKGTFADLANTGKNDRYGGATHGAKFLEQFVDNTPWAHLDIAPRMTTNEHDHLAKGASGVGVRYIVELAKNYKDFSGSLR
ncbi:MAG: leucyl aminopeptidase [bacterium]|nr:leucyl aminopeptidase [bacterium]